MTTNEMVSELENMYGVFSNHSGTWGDSSDEENKRTEPIYNAIRSRLLAADKMEERIKRLRGAMGAVIRGLELNGSFPIALKALQAALAEKEG